MKRIICVFVFLACLVGLLPTVQAVTTDGKSAVLMDVATGTVLYEQNAHEPLPPASVTKVMTMLLIMEAIDKGQIHWDDQVVASEAAAAKGGSQVYLKVGETMTVEEMVKSIAVSSANDCACAMAEYIAGSESAFVDRMNARAKELGMNDTHFVNCTGLDDDENAKDHKTSAYDIAVMSRELLKNHPDITQYTTIWMDTVRDGAFGLSNTNKLVRFYNGATGLKTGFTAKAGYCLSASAERDGMELIAVVMGCETSAQRFNSCKQLLDHGFANYGILQPELEAPATVPVKLGNQEAVVAIPAHRDAMLVEKGQLNQVTFRTQLDETVTAPVSRGQRLGTLSVMVGEQVLTQIPLVAQDSVGRRTWGQLFREVLQKVCMG